VLLEAPELARRVLDRRGLLELSRTRPAALEAELGLDRERARRLWAAFRLGRRVARARRPHRPELRSPERVHAHVAPELAGLDRERLLALLLDGQHRLRRTELVGQGTLTSSLVHPREVFRAAIREAAAAVIVVHNHPSGDPEPSAEDLEVTRRLVSAGQLVGIPLLDHVVVAEGGFVSIRERMVFAT
jgi:DNA repair protein RadC